MWVKCAQMLNVNFVTFELNEKHKKKCKLLLKISTLNDKNIYFV